MLGASSELKVRKARAADAEALADVFRQSWQHAYSGIIPHQHLTNLVRRRGRDWWASAIRSGDSVLALEFQRQVTGYATLGPARVRCAYEGEIYELYLSPTYQGLGFGEHLFEACRNGLDQRRFKGLLVWALTDNRMATDFYWRRGGRPFARAFDRMGGAKLEKIAFGWS